MRRGKASAWGTLAVLAAVIMLAPPLHLALAASPSGVVAPRTQAAEEAAGPAAGILGPASTTMSPDITQPSAGEDTATTADDKDAAVVPSVVAGPSGVVSGPVVQQAPPLDLPAAGIVSRGVKP